MSQTLLITGGCGFIGANLIALLLQRGAASIRVLDDESLGKREFIGESLPHVEFIQGDIRDDAALDRALAGCDSVVHLAADTRVIESIQNPDRNFDVNVIGSYRLLRAMQRHDVERIVAASTGGAIIGEAMPPVHEEMLARPSSPYGASKLTLEGYLSAFHGAYGMKTASLRFSNVYGPRSFHKGSVVAAFFKNILNGEPLTIYGDGSQVRDYIFVTDLVDGICRAVEDEKAIGVYQLGSGIGRPLSEVIEVMRSVVGPDWPVMVQYKNFRQGELRSTWCQIDKARAAFAFNPTTLLPDGLAETWEWFLANRQRFAK